MIPLGYTSIQPKATVGFHPNPVGVKTSKAITFNGESHLLTVCPTGGGKGVNCLIPTLLTYEGSTVTLDPKGENYKVTAKRRRAMGHQVVKFDPFKIIDDGFSCDGFNPLDLRHFGGFDIEEESLSLADQLKGKRRSTHSDIFWDCSAVNVVSAAIAVVLSLYEDEKVNLSEAIRFLMQPELVYEFAVVLDNHSTQLPEGTKYSIKTYLETPEQNTRPSVDATVNTYLLSLKSEGILKMLEKTTFSLEEFIVGSRPMDLYFVWPSDKLESHNGLLSMLLATLFKALLLRTGKPKHRNLFLLDETAALGAFPLLETIAAIGRGYGITMWLFLQDYAQLKRNFQDGASTLINNCGVHQFFGIKTFHVAKDIAAITGLNPQQIMSMASDEQYLCVDGEVYPNAKRLNYLLDKNFEGLYEPNSFYQPQPESLPKARPRPRSVVDKVESTTRKKSKQIALNDDDDDLF
ncbi:type IV secretory system conjugative DNA transfer family protein [Runella sp. SP2]|uniref:type IV secretory system conjugative DNA transfer family protein n=1 Tax=Runella sp. SP2 TaxID=2268026 RepID=UPI000F07448E|nr:type IV secretory system conjugative DNA transfer family protein [Runella sp. SP2]AYQ36560.1 type IV secretory system conjugative DNA transfer family protein [Runella sp. SP2]